MIIETYCRGRLTVLGTRVPMYGTYSIRDGALCTSFVQAGESCERIYIDQAGRYLRGDINASGANSEVIDWAGMGVILGKFDSGDFGITTGASYAPDDLRTDFIEVVRHLSGLSDRAYRGDTQLRPRMGLLGHVGWTRLLVACSEDCRF